MRFPRAWQGKRSEARRSSVYSSGLFTTVLLSNTEHTQRQHIAGLIRPLRTKTTISPPTIFESKHRFVFGRRLDMEQD
jgi:hypothetical protein